MSTSLDTIKLWSETVVRAEHWNEDPKVLPIPWRDVRLPDRLSIGIVYDDGLVTPHPPIQRGLREVARALEEAGHEVITFKPYDVMQAGELLKSLFLAGEVCFPFFASFETHAELISPSLSLSQTAAPPSARTSPPQANPGPKASYTTNISPRPSPPATYGKCRLSATPTLPPPTRRGTR